MTTSFQLDPDLQKRIENLLIGTESVSQFCYKAAEERVKRLEARDDRSRVQLAMRNKEIMKPIIREILKEEGVI